MGGKRRQSEVRRRPRGARPAFTLAEVLISVAILGLAFLALVSAFGHEAVVVHQAEKAAVATFLADEIRDLARNRDFAEVFDLDGTTYHPAVLSTGIEQGHAEFAQTISVLPLAREDLRAWVAQEDAGAARVDVVVTASGMPILTRSYYILDMEGVETD